MMPIAISTNSFNRKLRRWKDGAVGTLLKYLDVWPEKRLTLAIANHKVEKWIRNYHEFIRLATSHPEQMEQWIEVNLDELMRIRHLVHQSKTQPQELIQHCLDVVMEKRPDLAVNFAQRIRANDHSLEVIDVTLFKYLRKSQSQRKAALEVFTYQFEGENNNDREPMCIIGYAATSLAVRCGDFDLLNIVLKHSKVQGATHQERILFSHPLRSWLDINVSFDDAKKEHSLQALDILGAHGHDVAGQILTPNPDLDGWLCDYPNLLAMACDWHNNDKISGKIIGWLLDYGMDWVGLDVGDEASANVIRRHPAWRKHHLQPSVKDRQYCHEEERRKL